LSYPRHRLAFEQLRRDYAAILADCTAGLEQAKAKVEIYEFFIIFSKAIKSRLN
jgi:hypothetical protein